MRQKNFSEDKGQEFSKTDEKPPNTDRRTSENTNKINTYTWQHIIFIIIKKHKLKEKFEDSQPPSLSQKRKHRIQRNKEKNYRKYLFRTYAI